MSLPFVPSGSTELSQLYASHAVQTLISPQFADWGTPVRDVGTNITPFGATGFTLEPGFTYELLAHIQGQGTDNPISKFTWVTTTLTPVGELNSLGSWNSSLGGQEALATAVFTPLVTTTVHLEYTSNVPASGDEVTITAQSYVKITQLG